MSFDIQDYKENMQSFPDISFEEYQKIGDISIRKDIAKKNKIIQTDSYNRTMNHIKGDMGNKIENYSLSLRRSSNHEYNVIVGIKSNLLDILSIKITQSELDFAQDYYEYQKNKGGNGYFDLEMRQNVIDNGGYLPLKIKAVNEGTVLKPKEPAMIVSGPGELAAVYEPLFLRAFFKSAIATDALYIEQILGEGRVVEFGKRSSPNEDYHLDAIEANIIGQGLTVSSNDTASLVFPQIRTGGTIAHRYLSCYPNEDQAFLDAIKATDDIALLVDLADSYSGIDKVVTLKKKYRNSGKRIGMRLDSGDLAYQAVYALKALEKENMLDPEQDKIIIADIGSIEDLKYVEKSVKEAGFDPKKFIMYGLGGILVAKNKTRSAVSAGYKLIKTEDGATGKISDSIGKEPIPGEPNIEVRHDTKERVIVQEYEKIKGERLLNTVYDNGKFYYKTNSMRAIDEARSRLKETLLRSLYNSRSSSETTKVQTQVRKKLRSNIKKRAVARV